MSSDPAPNLRRLADWPERLHAYLQRHAATPFAWGMHDCARFAAGAVQAITAHDVLPADWRTRADAVTVLRALGGLVPAVDAALPRLARVGLAWRGDVVLVQTPALQGAPGARRRFLAVVDGGRWWSPGPDGLVLGPMSHAVQAWEVRHA